MGDEAQLDTPINRATIDQLPIATLDNWLTEIRSRRLVVVQKLQDVKEAKRRVYLNDVQDKYNKMYERVKGNLSKLDEAVEKIEVNITKLRALELELTDDDA